MLTLKTGFKMNCNIGSKIKFFQNKLTLSINNPQFVIDINSDEIYALTIEPLKHIPDHYHVKLLFEHNDEPSKEKIIKEKPNGKFVQCIDIYTMLDKIDTSLITKWSNYPSLLFIDKRSCEASSYAKHNPNHFQLLNLDYASGFDILSQYTNECNKTVTQHFFHVSYKKTDIVITYRNTFVNITEKDPKIPVSIVFNYLIDRWSIEVNIMQMMNAIAKQTKHSSKIINTIQFITENKLDSVD